MEKRSLKPAIDFAERDFPFTDKDDTLSHAFKLMEKYRSDRVLVTDDKIFVGIMTKRDILGKLMVERTRRVSASTLHVSSFMVHPLYMGTNDITLAEAANLMTSKGIGSLPLGREDEIVALLHKIDFAKAFIDKSELTANDVMTPLPKVSYIGDRLVKLREEFLKNNIVLLPVIDSNNGKIIGIVTVSEIADALFVYHDAVSESSRKRVKREIYVEDIMFRPPLLVEPEDPLEKAAKLMIENRKPGVVVVSKEKGILGLITAENLVSQVSSAKL